MLFAARLQCLAVEVGGAVTQEKVMSVIGAHEIQILGHMDEPSTRKTAHRLGWTLTRGSLGVCESCALANAKQNNVRSGEEPKGKHDDVNGRVYLR
jgi:hypothetical protein